jgi:hypothetical protein
MWNKVIVAKLEGLLQDLTGESGQNNEDLRP